MSTFLFCGTYTQKTKNEHRGEGIFAYRFDTNKGSLELTSASNAGWNPSFLRVHPNKRYVYTVNELVEGQISALALNTDSGSLTLLNSQPTRGAHPCYVSFDPSGKFALVSNYSSGSLAVYPIDEDGRLGAMCGFVEHVGSGPNKGRQERAHAHSIAFDLSGRYALAADLGIDRMLLYQLDPSTGALNLADLWGAAMRPGAGPRHFTCHPGGDVIYVANELDSTVTVCRWEAADGTLFPVQNLSTLPDGFTGENTVADIHLDPKASMLYVSNRGDNSLTVFRVVEGGELERLGFVSCGGKWPRNFTLDASGKWLLCANQYSDNIAVFQVDPDGMPQATGDSISVSSPVCLEFVDL
jgi:6-phosphogluconolactonase